MSDMPALYLGIDLSTQSVTGVFLDEKLALAAPALSVNFDAEFPEYGTRAGMNVSGSVVTSPVRMWLRALDALMLLLSETGLLECVKAVSFSGQQHGSVYWTETGVTALGKLRQSGAFPAPGNDVGGAEKEANRAGNNANGAGNETEGKGTAGEGAGNEANGVGNEIEGAGNEAQGAENVTDGAGKEAEEVGNGAEGAGNDKEGAGGEEEGAGSDAAVGFSFAGSLRDECFALLHSPIWADSSTADQCEALERSFPGGPAALASTTGSRSYARFTGPQISAVAERTPQVWEATARVSLVSSFAASLLLGAVAPIDQADASGMNLMDLRRRTWHDALLAATAPGLTEERLGGVPCGPRAVLGTVAAAVAARWGLPGDCAVVAASGDNPCAVAGLGLAEEGDRALSLGTSDTLLGVQAACEATPALEGHVMAHPTDVSAVFCMLCYANGGDARARLRDELCGGDWGAFDEALRSTPPGNDGVLGLRLDLPEITPVIASKGEWAERGGDVLDAGGIAALPPATRVRAAVEGRFLSMRLRGGALGLGAATRVLATGGGTASREILQVAADVFNAEVLVADVPDAAAVGAARRAAFALASSTREVGSFSAFLHEATGGAPLAVAARPNAEAANMYDDALLGRYLRLEERARGEAFV